MSHHPHDAGHRARHKATSKPRRVIAGLALPTSAAIALMFCATGAAVATSSKTQTAAIGQGASSLAPAQPTAASPAALRARHLKEIALAESVVRDTRAKALAHDLAVVRATTVARSVERKKLAARVAVAKRESLHSWRLPITNPVRTSGFGYRWGRLHAGTDYAVSTGTPLVAMSTGKVVFAGAMSGYGIMVDVRYWDGTVSRYGHMSRVSVSVGDSVEPGEVVGKSGNTGHSTGPHLHLEMHPRGGAPVDPGPWLARHRVTS